jgi:predicted RNA-binding protein YlqC (UPF0109 family)
MSSIDEQFVEYIVKSLVNNPDAVSINRTIDEKGVLLELTVHPEDLGRVIGKRGATAQCLRTLLRALGTKNEARYNLKIVDNGTGPKPQVQSPSNPTAPVNDNNDDAVANDQTQQSPQAPAQDDDQTVQAEESTQTHTSTLDKTRQELAELDDLDV